MGPNVDCLIVGHGLAGATLAHALIQRGRRVVVMDDWSPSATSVAAGVVTPITGPRLALTWGFHELLPIARRFYAECARQWRVAPFFRQRPLIRAFADSEEQRQLEKQMSRRPDIAALVNPLHPPWPEALAIAPLGAFQTNGAAQLDTRRFLAASVRALRARGALIRSAFDWHAFDPSTPVTLPDGRRADRVVSCEGYRALYNPLFADLPFIPAKGELLRLKLPAAEESRILNRRGKWLLRHDEHTWLAGATFQKEVLDHRPSIGARREILAGISAYWKSPLTEDAIIGQHAGVRPIIPGAKLAIGPHPDHPRLLAFNGLGSKGVLRAPKFAEDLAAWIDRAEPIPQDASLATHIVRARQKKQTDQQR